MRSFPNVSVEIIKRPTPLQRFVCVHQLEVEGRTRAPNEPFENVEAVAPIDGGVALVID